MANDYSQIGDTEFTVRIKDGEVFIDDEFVAQLCWTSDAIASAIIIWLEEENR